MYAVFDVSDCVQQRFESLGTKEKVWILPDEGHPLPARQHLFKIGRPNTGENWAEKAAFEISKLIGLPAASYEFATLDGESGVVSERFMPDSAFLFPGNFFLTRIINAYDGTKKFRQLDYKINHVFGVVRNLQDLRNPIGWEDKFAGLPPEHVFIGYLIFDALVGNTDRHHENWGVVLDTVGGDAPTVHLAPSFDHASCLGRNETAERRRQRLETNDKRGDVEAYAQRAKSAFFLGTDSSTLSLPDLVRYVHDVSPQPVSFWADRICSVSKAQFECVFEMIPPDLIDADAIAFAIRMLVANQSMISDVVNEQ